MLNRKLSNYIFYGALLIIALIIVGIRMIVLGGINSEIEITDANNIVLQNQIDNLEEVVQDNRNIQTNHLYELYGIIPNVYSGTELTYSTVALLEELGIDESDDTQRSVFINHTVGFTEDSIFKELSLEYYVVEVQVFFTTQDVLLVNELIDDLNNSEQLFIIKDLEYAIPTDDAFTGVQISFLAFYDVDANEAS